MCFHILYLLENKASDVTYVNYRNEEFLAYTIESNYSDSINVDLEDFTYFLTAVDANDNHSLGAYYTLEGTCTLGDLNENSEINVADVVVLVNLALIDEFNFSCDMDKNGTCNIVDIILLVNRIFDL